MEWRLSRRQFLATVGACGFVLLTGCGNGTPGPTGDLSTEEIVRRSPQTVEAILRALNISDVEAVTRQQLQLLALQHAVDPNWGKGLSGSYTDIHGDVFVWQIGKESGEPEGTVTEAMLAKRQHLYKQYPAAPASIPVEILADGNNYCVYYPARDGDHLFDTPANQAIIKAFMGHLFAGAPFAEYALHVYAPNNEMPGELTPASPANLTPPIFAENLYGAFQTAISPTGEKRADVIVYLHGIHTAVVKFGLPDTMWITGALANETTHLLVADLVENGVALPPNTRLNESISTVYNFGAMFIPHLADLLLGGTDHQQFAQLIAGKMHEIESSL